MREKVILKGKKKILLKKFLNKQFLKEILLEDCQDFYRIQMKYNNKNNKKKIKIIIYMIIKVF